MKIRTQLVLAWFVLSILPLSVIVLYSYHSSRKALESAYAKETQQLTKQMDRRLTTIRTDLDERLAALSTMPIETIPTTNKNDPARAAVVDNILMAMGESAPLVDALEFVPTNPQPAAHPVPVVAAAPHPPAPAAAPKVAEKPPAADTGDGDDDPEVQVDTDAEMAPPAQEPILIDLPPVVRPKFVLPPEFNTLVTEIGVLSRQMSDPKTSPQERERIGKLIGDKNKELTEAMNDARADFRAAMKDAEQERAERLRDRAAALAERQKEREEAAAERAQERAQGTPETPAAKKAPAAPGAPGAPTLASEQVRVQRKLSAEDKAKLKANEKQTSLILGRRFDVSLSNKGEVVGQLRAQLSTREIVKRILGSAVEDRDEIPFAVDREGNVYTRNDGDLNTLTRLGVVDKFKNRLPVGNIEGWTIAQSEDKESGLRIGAVRPVGENLQELKNTAARNFGYGLGLIAFALIGIVPLANHLTRDVNLVTNGASRIAQGDLQTRLPVRSNNEFGQLATAFNSMAEDLSRHQQQIYEQERARREQEVQQRVFSLEYERKSVELEDARRFQLSMLPKHVPLHDRYDVAVFTVTATEVGGDYYDFHVDPEKCLSVTIGDATGHGAKAGTMVTVIKTLFAGYDSKSSPAEFLRDAAEKIKRMDLGRMAMALSLARFEDRAMTIASAGMPGVLVHRKDRGVEEVELQATPLGTLGMEYAERRVEIGAGDTILLMSDGFPELQNASGQQLGYGGAMDEFVAAAEADDANGVIADLTSSVHRWHGDQPPNDDITFVVVRCRA